MGDLGVLAIRLVSELRGLIAVLWSVWVDVITPSIPPVALLLPIYLSLEGVFLILVVFSILTILGISGPFLISLSHGAVISLSVNVQDPIFFGISALVVVETRIGWIRIWVILVVSRLVLVPRLPN